MRAVGSLPLTTSYSFFSTRCMRIYIPPSYLADRRHRGPPPRSSSWVGRDSRTIDTIDHRYAVTHTQPQSVMLHGYEKPKEEVPLEIPYPKEIVAFLDQFVVGQALAKKTLAVGVYQHYKRVEFNMTNNECVLLRMALEKAEQRKADQQIIDEGKRGLEELKRTRGFQLSADPNEDVFMDKSNIILLGPSGSGKTYLTTRLAQALNVPIALCDCTTLTQAGYVGEDVESVIQKLLVNADGDVAATERGIVFLDEFDKIYNSSDPAHTAGNRDVNGKGVQQALLKLVEGTKCLVKNPLNSNSKVEIDTANILFVASGAFAGLDRIVARRLDERTLGFNSTSRHLWEALHGRNEEEVAAARSRLLTETDQNDLISYGMVPELVGRFPVLVPFDQLDEAMLREVLTKPRNNIISQSKALLSLDSVDLEFTECAIAEMARMAVKRKTGARALRSILEKILLQAKYECPGSEPCTVTINGAVVRGEQIYKRIPTRPFLLTDISSRNK